MELVGSPKAIPEEVKKAVEAKAAELGNTPQINLNVQDNHLTAKQLEKQKKKEEAFWNSMVTRGEVKANLDQVQGYNQQVYNEFMDRLRTIYITNKAMMDLLVAKGILTEAEITAKAEEVMKLIMAPEEIVTAPVQEQISGTEQTGEPVLDNIQ